MASYHVPSYYDMTAGDELIAQIRRACRGTHLRVSLVLAEELATYNSDHDVNLTFGEFVEAFYPRRSEVGEDPD